MSWNIRQDSRCPADEPWGVVDSLGLLVGCHETREQALVHRAALCATRNRWARVDWTPAGG